MGNTNYNPIPGDNAAALQAAVNALATGDVLMIQPAYASLAVNGQVALADNKTIDLNGATLTHAPTSPIFKTGGLVKNVTIRNGTLKGGGVAFDKVDGLTFTRMTVRSTSGGTYEAGCGVYANQYFNSNVTNNDFRDCFGWACIWGYGAANSHFDDNAFYNTRGDCVHFITSMVNSVNVTFNRNYVNGYNRAPFEIQDSDPPPSGQPYFVNVQVVGNVVLNSTADWTTGASDFGCAFSVPLQFSDGILVANNYSDATVGWALEACGINYTIDGNTFGMAYSPTHFSGNAIGVDGRQQNVRVTKSNRLLHISNQAGILSNCWGVDASKGGVVEGGRADIEAVVDTARSTPGRTVYVMPPPPASPNAGVAGVASTPTPNPTPGPTMTLTAKADSTKLITVSAAGNPGPVKVAAKASTTAPAVSLGTIPAGQPSAQFDITPLLAANGATSGANWEIDLNATAADGTTATAHVKMMGADPEPAEPPPAPPTPSGWIDFAKLKAALADLDTALGQLQSANIANLPQAAMNVVKARGEVAELLGA